MCMWIMISSHVCVLDRRSFFFGEHANADVECEVFLCFFFFFERAEVLDTVSQCMHHVVVKVRGLKRSVILNLESTVAI